MNEWEGAVKALLLVASCGSPPSPGLGVPASTRKGCTVMLGLTLNPGVLCDLH